MRRFDETFGGGCWKNRRSGKTPSLTEFLPANGLVQLHHTGRTSRIVSFYCPVPPPSAQMHFQISVMILWCWWPWRKSRGKCAVVFGIGEPTNQARISWFRYVSVVLCAAGGYQRGRSGEGQRESERGSVEMIFGMGWPPSGWVENK